MLTRLVSNPRALVLLAVVTLVVPPAVLGRYGMFRDWSTEGAAFSWGMFAWLVGPYVAFAALLVWASRSSHVAFRVAVAVTAIVVVLQSVVLDLVSLSSDDALASVGVLALPVLCFGGAAVLAVVGLVLHLRGRHPASAAPGLPLSGGSPTAR